ncbi:MAG: response regulator [Bacteroidota bacterium]|nr:response regulator [Bacteroidota bacterium]
MKNRILIVEDDDVNAFILSQNLEKMGFSNIYQANSHSSAIKSIAKFNPELLLMDINLIDEITGIDIVKEVHLHSRIPVIFISGTCNQEEIIEAKSLPNCLFMEKPVDFGLLRNKIFEILKYPVIIEHHHNKTNMYKKPFFAV